MTSGSQERVRKFIILLAAVAMQVCLGATYSWSAFVTSIREFWEIRQGFAQIPFTVFYVVFPVTTILGGALLSKLGLRLCAALGGLLFGGGWLFASLGRIDFSFTIVGIGIIAGVGAGLAYLVPIQTCVLWFPKHKALVTGIAVAGFGGGAALVTTIGSRLMSAGRTPFEVFQMVGLAFLVIVPIAGSAMRLPHGAQPPVGASIRIKSLLHEPLFRLLYFAMITGLMAGFAVNANLKQFVGREQLQLGTIAVSVFALGNAAGRILWGMTFDRIPRFGLIAANLLFQAALLVAAFAMIRSKPMFISFAALAGFNYGGVLVLYAGMTAHLWGRAAVGRIYGCLFSSNAVAAIAPFAAGAVFDSFGSFTPALVAIAAAMVVAAVTLVVIGNSRNVKLRPSE